MPCFLNDWNDLNLQFLQVLLIFYGALHKGQSNKLLPADCMVHHAGLSDVSAILCRFSEAQNMFCLCKNPSQWK